MVGRHLKGDSSTYCTICTVLSPFDVTEAAPLPLAATDQQAELYRLTWICALPKGKTPDVCTQHALE